MNSRISLTLRAAKDLFKKAPPTSSNYKINRYLYPLRLNSLVSTGCKSSTYAWELTAVYLKYKLIVGIL